MDFHDTIAAIATAVGEASIAVIRVSGNQAVDVVDRIFKGKNSLKDVASHTVWFGRIYSMDGKRVIDEVLVTVMKGPKTYTTEDVVEISTHGGFQAVQEVLGEVIRAGARIADPGEFTKRAFLGGRIDLTQAEGVMELIRSQTDAAKAASLRQLEGSMTTLIRNIRHQMIQLMAHIEVTIDYPEHDEEEATLKHVYVGVSQLEAELLRILTEANQGRILRDGIRVAIVGRPNVGKSSLLNQLARFDRAIVTDIPGTTRDVLEERIQIGGVPLKIMDTAGIRETLDVVEQLGVQRSKKALRDADLVLIMIDQSRDLSDTDIELMQEAKNLPVIVILSKSDLVCRTTANELQSFVDLERVIHFSVFDRSAIENLETLMIEVIFHGDMQPKDATFVANSRHISLIESALENLKGVLEAIRFGQTLDLVAVDLHSAWVTLGEIIGETPREDLLDQIFSQFCLGK